MGGQNSKENIVVKSGDNTSNNETFLDILIIVGILLIIVITFKIISNTFKRKMNKAIVNEISKEIAKINV